ncbi:transcription factor Spi-C isoform X2 [Anolis carolinensis]|uniref:transcription factor Spi-C isoform X2 n=1 Tax=Anolis carolinensis TaxID=28377 RepID=UPI002F2B63FB
MQPPCRLLQQQFIFAYADYKSGSVCVSRQCLLLGLKSWTFKKMDFTDQDLLGQALEDALEVLQRDSDGEFNYAAEGNENCLTYHHHSLQEKSSYLEEPSTEQPTHNWRTTITEANFYPDRAVYHTLQTVPQNRGICATPLQHKGGKGRKKLRLFEYLHESLHNPDMENCIQWIDKPNGIFQFVSKNKEKLAELWGECKGNRKIMTYQKMARALRNYGKTGEIIKIRRKLTYQFGAVLLQKLCPSCFLGKDEIIDQYAQDDNEYQCANGWFSYYYTYKRGHE